MTPGAREALGREGGGVRTAVGEGQNDTEGTTANHRHPRRARQTAAAAAVEASHLAPTVVRSRRKGGGKSRPTQPGQVLPPGNARKMAGSSKVIYGLSWIVGRTI